METEKTRERRKMLMNKKQHSRSFMIFFLAYKVRACGVESVTGRCFQTSKCILLFSMTSRSVGAGDAEEKRVKYRGVWLMVTNQVG